MGNVSLISASLTFHNVLLSYYGALVLKITAKALINEFVFGTMIFLIDIIFSNGIAKVTLKMASNVK